MGPRRPEIEYIHLENLAKLKKNGNNRSVHDAYEALHKLARGALKKGPFSITFDKKAPYIAASGDKRDFISYAPYWWPEDGKNAHDADIRYIRRDGHHNPDVKNAHDQRQMDDFSENLTYLVLGYFVFEKEEYGQHAVRLIDTFLLNEETRMNPNLNYGQVVRGKNNPSGLGRGEGIISTRSLARVANVLPLLESFKAYAKLKERLHAWFQEYLHWLLTSPVTANAKKAIHNIHSWYVVHITAIQGFVDSSHVHSHLRAFFSDILPKQIDRHTGDQPLESRRTRPLHYLMFNMKAVIYLAEMGRSIGLDFYHEPPALIQLAVDHIAHLAKQTNEDVTGFVREMEIMSHVYKDHHQLYGHFIHAARHSHFAEHISGPKNALAPLWSYKA
ncbi:hypothetical protein EC973_007040 [Apophysomyces ossiformis]|uniref:Alginate lyase domain-containing protein n=1 Tax=Apophysomyces ossiformis TaxID=679940 RepID=A0A8H7BUE6_9FUNG|nr:hypothetical protein EC973_007040 [Apophysomyces ossiformis]